MTNSNKSVISIAVKTAARPTVRPIAQLDGSLLLARKGEASPAVAATQHNNPGLAWGEPLHPADFQPRNTVQGAPAHVQGPAAHGAAHGYGGETEAQGTVQPHHGRLRPDSFFASRGRGVQAPPRTRVIQDRDTVALTMRVEDDTYLRLRYLAQSTGRSTQQVLSEALDDHLGQNRVPQARKLVVRPS